MLNIKTFYNTVFRHNHILKRYEAKEYYIFTNGQIVVYIKKETNIDLFKELSEISVCEIRFAPSNAMNTIIEKFENTFDNEENNINSIYKNDSRYTIIDSEDGKITWFASRLLACISKRYKGGKEFVKNTPVGRYENFRIYYKGDKDLFVVILPIHVKGNDGVTYRK